MPRPPVDPTGLGPTSAVLQRLHDEAPADHFTLGWLMHSLRGLAPRTSSWRDPQFETKSFCLIKVAGRVTEMVTRIKIALPTAYPYQIGFTSLAGRLAKLPP